MRTIKLNLVMTRIVILTIMVILTSCGKSRNMESNVSENIPAVAATRLEIQGAASRARRLDGKPCRKKVDMEVWYQSGLKKYGVNDFSNQNLIKLLESKNERHRYYSILLLGERKESSAIPKLEEALGDESYYVWLAAAESLLKMDNRKGMPVLQEFCAKVSKEVQNEQYRNLTHMLDASRVMADAGEVSVIPYLRQLSIHRSAKKPERFSSGLRPSSSSGRGGTLITTFSGAVVLSDGCLYYCRRGARLLGPGAATAGVLR